MQLWPWQQIKKLGTIWTAKHLHQPAKEHRLNLGALMLQMGTEEGANTLNHNSKKIALVQCERGIRGKEAGKKWLMGYLIALAKMMWAEVLCVLMADMSGELHAFSLLSDVGGMTDTFISFLTMWDVLLTWSTFHLQSHWAQTIKGMIEFFFFFFLCSHWCWEEKVI